MGRIAVLAVTSMIGFSLAAGCTDRDVSKEDPCIDVEQPTYIPIEFKHNVDILFVIDNSGSMKEEQDSLAQNFNRFMAVLENIEGGMPNVHIGVVSTDVGIGTDIPGCTGNGDNGILQGSRGAGAPAGCEPPQGSYIEDIASGNERIRNYNGTLADTFACIAELGTNGCGFEQPLEAMYRALGNNVENAGFLRDDAFLLVVFVTDEDDCSARGPAMFDDQDSTLGPLSSFRCFEYGVVCDPDGDPRAPGPRQNCRPRDDSEYMHPISRYVDFLKSLKDDPSKVLVAGIIGETPPVEVTVDANENPALAPSCISASGEATPAVRLTTFLEQFPQRHTNSTICEEDLSDALGVAAYGVVSIFGPPCLRGALVDNAPDTPGVQPECQVSDVRFPDTGYEEEYPMPHCDVANGALPCWRLQENLEECNAENMPTHLELIVERGDASPLPGTRIEARCAVNLENSCPAN